MGLGDKFKNLAKQAQDAVAEHKDQIHDAVESVSVAADRKTGGKYTDKIAKFGQKAGETVDKIADAEAPAGSTPPPPAGSASPPPAPPPPASAPPAGSASPPPASPPPVTPSATPPADHSAPSFDE